MTIVNTFCVYFVFAERVVLTYSHHTHTHITTCSDEYFHSLDCGDHFTMYMSIKHQVVHLKYIQFPLANYISIKLTVVLQKVVLTLI